MKQFLELGRRSEFVREALKGAGVLILLVLMMMWLAGAFVNKVESGPVAEKPQPAPVRTLKVERRLFPLLVDQVGTIRAQTEAQISARIMAQVKEILVREGDLIVGGDGKTGSPTVMARLDDREIQARLRQAESQITASDRAVEAARARLGAAKAQMEAGKANKQKAAADYRRFEELRKNQAAAGQQLDHARAQRDVAEAQVQGYAQDVQAAQGELARAQAQREQAEAALTEARVMLSYTQIRAPFTGKILKKMVNVGDMTTPGQPLFFVEIPSRAELHATVTESLIPLLKPGQKLDVHIDALHRDCQGELGEVILKSDPATRTVLVKVSLPPDPDLVNGLFGRLRVPYGEYEALLIPEKAVREVGQLYLVDVVGPDGKVHRRFVTLGHHHGEMVEVLSGVQESEEVVLP